MTTGAKQSELLHICAVCAFEYENKNIMPVQPGFHDLAEAWQCPDCGIGTEMFHHYSCAELVTAMTGKRADQSCSTQDLKHHVLSH